MEAALSDITGGWSAGYFNSVGSKEGWAVVEDKGGSLLVGREN